MGKEFPKKALIRKGGYYSPGLRAVIQDVGDREILILGRSETGCGCYAVQFPDDVEEKHYEFLKRLKGIKRPAFDYIEDIPGYQVQE